MSQVECAAHAMRELVPDQSLALLMRSEIEHVLEASGKVKALVAHATIIMLDSQAGIVTGEHDFDRVGDDFQDFLHKLGKGLVASHLMPLAIALSFECWSAVVDPEEYKAMQLGQITLPRPVDCPNRVELVTVIAMTLDGRGRSSAFDIVRDAAGRLHLGQQHDELTHEPDGKTGSHFTSGIMNAFFSGVASAAASRMRQTGTVGPMPGSGRVM